MMTDAAQAATQNGTPEIRRRSKLDRYGWTTIDMSGEMRLIDVQDLDVDHSYQRAEVENKIRTMAREWSWVGCGALSVARRRNGRYFVMDGQQRLAAALRRGDITQLPCVIFDVKDIEEEARGFLATNTLRKPVTAIDKFKAMVISGQPVAVKVQELCEESGVVIHNYGAASNVRDGDRMCKCVSTLMALMQADEGTLRAIWPLVVEVCTEGTVQDKIVQSLFYLESRLSEQSPPLSLLRQPWRGRVVRLGQEGILAACHRAAAYYVSGGAKVWASGVAQALNKGVVNRLSIGGAEEMTS